MCSRARSSWRPGKSTKTLQSPTSARRFVAPGPYIDQNATQRRPPRALCSVWVIEKPILTALQIADPPDKWEALGFHITDHTCNIGPITITLGAEGKGITGWSIANLPPHTTEIDGLPTEAKEPSTLHQQTSPPHPNGAQGIDHVVITTPDFDQTKARLEHAGIPLRRIACEPPARMGFRRLGPTILELVEAPQAPKTSFWGLVIVVEDLEALTKRLTTHLSPSKPAVQPGRHITTLKPTAGLTPAVAFMDPEPST